MNQLIGDLSESCVFAWSIYQVERAFPTRHRTSNEGGVHGLRVDMGSRTGRCVTRRVSSIYIIKTEVSFDTVWKHG